MTPDTIAATVLFVVSVSCSVSVLVGAILGRQSEAPSATDFDAHVQQALALVSDRDMDRLHSDAPLTPADLWPTPRIPRQRGEAS